MTNAVDAGQIIVEMCMQLTAYNFELRTWFISKMIEKKTEQSDIFT